METIQAIKLTDLYPFPNNPFKVLDNEDLQAITESVKAYGIISPLVVRPRDEGGYEIIAGHRRARACEKAGIDIVPAFVRFMDRDTAVIALVDSNLHREHILPSEKAFAYKMKLEAIKHQGQRTDLTLAQVVPKLPAREIVADEVGVNRMEISRYIRLTELIPSLLELVDNGQIAFSPAVELSYLAQKEQFDLLETIESEERTPSLSQAQRMKKLSQDGKLNMDTIFSIMTEEKPNQKEQIKLKKDSVKGFFPKNYTVQQMEQTIMKLLADWQRRREQRNKDSR
jgi:ParB family chromosome partitioning protein